MQPAVPGGRFHPGRWVFHSGLANSWSQPYFSLDMGNLLNKRGTKRSASPRFAYDGLDRVIHERARLSVLTSLVTHSRGLLFGDLKQLCALTDGNLNRHLQVLEPAPQPGPLGSPPLRWRSGPAPAEERERGLPRQVRRAAHPPPVYRWAPGPEGLVDPIACWGMGTMD